MSRVGDERNESRERETVSERRRLEERGLELGFGVRFFRDLLYQIEKLECQISQW